MAKKILGALCIVIAAALLILIDNTCVKLTHYTVKSGEIPPQFDGFKIIQLSDIHGTEFGENNSVLVEKIKRAEPDIIVITGDILDSIQKTDIDIEVFDALLPQLDDVAPMYGVSGNHDISASKFIKLSADWEAEYNIEFLENETVTLSRNGAEIYLSGMDDPKYYDEEKRNERFYENLAELDVPDGFNILLFHRADMLNMLLDSEFDVVFAGHLHGGQWRIPFIGGVIDQARRPFPEYSGGRYRRGGKTFIVSCGVGNNQRLFYTEIPFPRIFNMAEIVEVTLEAQE